MNSNGSNEMKNNNQQNGYVAYEDYDAGSGYARNGYSSAESLERELFYNVNNTNGSSGSSYREQGSFAPSATEYANSDNYEEYADENGEDSRPSQTTMQFRNQNPYELSHEEGENASQRRYKISTKGKVIAAVYAIVIATILALIVLNTQLLKNMDEQIAAQQTRIDSLIEQGQQLTETYDYLRSDDVIEQKAEDLGMVHD